MCVRAFGALHAAAPWRTTNFDTKIEAVIAGRRYFIACDGGDGEKPTLAIYASYADAQPRNEAKQHDSYLVTFGGFFARREAQPRPRLTGRFASSFSARTRSTGAARTRSARSW